MTYDPAGNQLAPGQPGRRRAHPGQHQRDLQRRGPAAVDDRRARQHHGVHLRPDRGPHRRDPAGEQLGEHRHVVRLRRRGEPDPLHRRQRPPLDHHLQQLEPARRPRSSRPPASTPPRRTPRPRSPTTATGSRCRRPQPGGVTDHRHLQRMGEVTGQSGAGATAPTATRSFSYDTAGEHAHRRDHQHGGQRAAVQRDQRGVHLQRPRPAADRLRLGRLHRLHLERRRAAGGGRTTPRAPPATPTTAPAGCTRWPTRPAAPPSPTPTTRCPSRRRSPTAAPGPTPARSATTACTG